MRRAVRYLWLPALAAAAFAADRPAAWLDQVGPILSPAERSAYRALPPAARPDFEKHFWDGKAISAEEYFERVTYVDGHFGGGKTGSGANTDQGRVYLSLGSPNRITRLPSSRNFFPLEIWYYQASPALSTTGEVRLLFYLKNGQGLYKLYSPTMNTIRELLVPQAGLLGMFGPNDVISESDIRTRLNSTAIEDEVVSAASSVAIGITGAGNDEILAEAMAPRRAITRPLHPDVKSKLVAFHPKMDFLQSTGPFGGTQVDFVVETAVQHKLTLEVLLGAATVYRSESNFPFENPRTIRYAHRLDLLPGQYRVLLTIDGVVAPYPLEIGPPRTGDILLASRASDSAGRDTPFQFGLEHLEPAPDGSLAVLALAQPGPVEWILRRGLEVRWKKTTSAQSVAMVALPLASLEPGSYRLEAIAGAESRAVNLTIDRARRDSLTFVSYNANLAPALRLATVGHQWLLRGNLADARLALEASLQKTPTIQGQIELSRLEALSGQLDEARERLRPILRTYPDEFEALAVLGFIEAKLQDYQVAAQLYKRALAVHDSPAVRLALASLPH